MYGRYFVLFAILFTGWFLRKINFIDDKMDHSINKLVVYFAYPCLIVHNIGEQTQICNSKSDPKRKILCKYPF